MGAVQRLATVVIIGLIGISVVLVLYLADEDNRISHKTAEQQNVAIERAISNYIQFCLQCHGPAGEGYMAPGEEGTGRIGMPLGGNTYATNLNQQGIDAQGNPVPGGVEARATAIAKVLHNGRGLMPAWGTENGGELNDEQINELVIMIQHVDWNEMYNHIVEVSGGYPTAVPLDEPTPVEGAPAATPVLDEGVGTPVEGEAPAGAEAPPAAGVTIVSKDILFEPATAEIAADTDATFTLPNEGMAPHNFSIDALNISVDIAPGATETVTVNAPVGEYEFYCNVPGHKEAGMVGKLTVK